jgi:hypothetical protein
MGFRELFPGAYLPHSNIIAFVFSVKFTLKQTTKAQREVEVYIYSFFSLGARWGGWSTPQPGRFTPGKTRYPFYRRLGWPQGWSGRVRKISPLTGIDPWTVHIFGTFYH